jgi:hypothetical protein
MANEQLNSAIDNEPIGRPFLVKDPILAEEMACAEAPYRESIIEIRESWDLLLRLLEYALPTYSGPLPETFLYNAIETLEDKAQQASDDIQSLEDQERQRVEQRLRELQPYLMHLAGIRVSNYEDAPLRFKRNVANKAGRNAEKMRPFYQAMGFRSLQDLKPMQIVKLRKAIEALDQSES